MKLKGSFETETFITESGYYAITQDVLCDRCDHQHSAVIHLTPSQMRHVISSMEAALTIKGEWFSERDGGV